MDGHDLMSNEDGAQPRKTEDNIVFFPHKEKGQDALFPEMGVTTAIMDDLQTADIVAVLNRGLRTDEDDRLMLFSQGLTHIVGIAFDTRHGLGQESAVDIYRHHCSV